MKKEWRKITGVVLLAAAASNFVSAETKVVPPYDGALKGVIQSDVRAKDHQARDEFRNPLATLSFFGIQPSMTVVEVWPGGGWYTDILAPYLKDKGQYIAAHFDATGSSEYYKKSVSAFKAKMDGNKAVYGNVEVTVFSPPEKTNVAKKESADMVLTFRNVHNWYMRGGEESISASFNGFFNALKPGGVLGVVEHRLPESRDQEENKNSGYMKQSYVIALAEKAGFKLVAQSEINANKKDTADHEFGVWTLPPRLRKGDDDRAKYVEIGESDRMTLKFIKPLK